MYMVELNERKKEERMKLKKIYIYGFKSFADKTK